MGVRRWLSSGGLRASLWDGCVRIGFEGHFYLRTLLELDLLTIFIDKGIFNADFLIQIVGTIDGDLRLFRLCGNYRFDDLLYRALKVNTGFFSHNADNYTAESVELSFAFGVFPVRPLGFLQESPAIFKRPATTRRKTVGTLPTKRIEPMDFPALTPKPERGTLKAMVVACASGASIPAGSNSLQNNRLFYGRKSAAVPRLERLHTPYARSKGLSVGPWRRVPPSE